MRAEIPKEIRDFKEKIVFGLTARQLIATIFTLAICVPVYIWGRPYLGDDIASWICIFVGFPTIGIGFFKYNGMTFEQFLGAFIKQNILYPQKRKFKVENFFETLEKSYDDLEKANSKNKTRGDNHVIK